MKRLNFKLWGILLSVMSCLSCGDNELLELSQNAEEANQSYENQFKAIWTALDLNYQIWDYEREEYGLDWDAVYDTYLPKFQDLDTRYKATGDTVCWETAQSLYSAIFKNLHDGHINFRLKDVYSNKEARLLESDLMAKAMENTLGLLSHRKEWDRYRKEGCGGHVLLDEKNTFKAFDSWDEEAFYWYGHFDNDVVYLHFPAFKFSDVYDKVQRTEKEETIVAVWKAWFDKVQQLHKSNKLKGVVLDIRHNSGGNMSDYQYFLGALHGDVDGNGTIKTGRYRMRLSAEREDYDKDLKEDRDVVLNIYPADHALVTAPIIVLADSLSASMAEHTCLAAKKLPNAYVIGTKTFGAFSPMTDYKEGRFTFWGNIGDPDLKTSSFYIHMPYTAFVTYEGKIIEGKGVEPDVVRQGDDVLKFAMEYISGLNSQSQ